MNAPALTGVDADRGGGVRQNEAARVSEQTGKVCIAANVFLAVGSIHLKN
jgi:hypothetical protein